MKWSKLIRNGKSDLTATGRELLGALICSLLLLLLLLLLTAIESSLGGSSTYTSTDKTNKKKYT
jgi:hypothetical protein